MVTVQTRIPHVVKLCELIAAESVNVKSAAALYRLYVYAGVVKTDESIESVSVSHRLVTVKVIAPFCVLVQLYAGDPPENLAWISRL